MALNYNGLQCSDLRQILKSKGVPFSNKNKQELIDLCETADALQLPQANHDDADASIRRRTVRGITHPQPNDKDSAIAWTSNLVNIPSVDTFDVTSFLQNYCGWSADRIRRRKTDNGYKLHCSGHIHDVNMAALGRI
jgi:hypothetical protein